MQHLKGNKKISDTNQFFKDGTTFLNVYSTLLKEFKLSKINLVLSSSKTKGINGKNIFQVLFVLPFLDIANIRNLMGLGISAELCGKKDVYYDFLKNERIDWRRILWLFVQQFLRMTTTKSVDENPSPKCLIIDDSILPKSGKKTELIGKVYDHGDHLYKLGMKLLTLGYWDGKSFLPYDFSLHNEPGKTKSRGLKKKHIKAQFSKKREEGSAGGKRVEEVSKDKISIALTMIKRAFKKIRSVDYVLADSWFITERFIKEIRTIDPGGGKNPNVIGLMKSNRVLTMGKSRIKASSVPGLKRKLIKYCSKHKCHYVALRVEYKDIPLKIFCVKMRGQENWKILVTTDEKLGFTKAMKYYQIRWSIEVFFKDCKQNMGLNKCQSIDFDAHIASISICFMNYIVLSLRKRFDDYETLGELFKHLKEDFLEATIIEKIWLFLDELCKTILAELGVDRDVFIKKLIENETNVVGQMKNELSTLFSINRKAA